MQTAADHPEAPTAIRHDLGAIFHLVGTKSFNLADHIAVSGRRRENVEAFGARRQCRRTAGALRSTSGEGSGSNGSHLSDHRHSGSGVGRLLDSSCAAE